MSVVRQTWRGVVAAGLACTVLSSPLAAQSGISLRQAVEQALAGEPGIAAVEAERAAASAGIELARHAYWPRIEGVLQVNRATHNNVAGLLFPQSVLAPISGPPSLTNSRSSVWGTAAGALVTWEPFDFGARASAVDAARHANTRAGLTVVRTRLEIAALVADTYLTVLAAEETVKAAQAAVTRAGALTTVVDALVRAELRPGVDLTSIGAERAAAAIQVGQARRAADVALSLLRRYVGADVRPNTAGLPPVATGAPSAPAPSASPPAVLERQAAIDESMARLDGTRRSADPRIAVQGTVFGRGSGVLDDNSSGGGANGLAFDTYNWAAGITVVLPLTERLHKPAREAIEAARVRAATARRDQTIRDLSQRIEMASQEVAFARDLATQMPAVVAAARAAHEQATARYRAGLSSVTDVAEAQRRLAQAEIDAAIVELSGWRARLAAAALTAATAEDFLRALPGTP